jgi:deazaflavin-dependent oxidoreductase (nitroreductase family)
VSLQGEYEPSPQAWVREQVDAYERSAGAEANTLLDTGIPIVVVTALGNKTGKIRKFAVMRVEHDGEYALIASKGGAPTHPLWYSNVTQHPHVMIQDGPEPRDYDVVEIDGDERERWWERAVAVYPAYAEYQLKTDRRIPVLLARRTK